MPYTQHRFLNPTEPRYDWRDAMPKAGCATEQPFQIPPLQVPWPEVTDLWGAAWPNGLPQAGAVSFDGRPPPNRSEIWTTPRGSISGLSGLLPFAEVGGVFDFVKVGVILAGGLVGGYLVGYLFRELRTPRATNRRGSRRRRQNAARPRRRNSETAKWRGYDDGFAGRPSQPPKGVWEREAYAEGYAMGRREKAAERAVARRYHEV